MKATTTSGSTLYSKLASVCLAVGLLALLMTAGRAWLGHAHKSHTVTAPADGSGAEQGDAVAHIEDDLQAENGPSAGRGANGKQSTDPGPGAAAPEADSRPILPPVSAQFRQTVAQVCLWDAQESLNSETAASWKLNFEQLLQGGLSSVAAIAEALKPNTERFFTAEEAALLGYPSARTALLDALARIGGPEATGVLKQVLDVAAAPHEIALVAKSLETLAPGEYTSQAVEAARQTLAMAREKQLEGFDVAPLFEVLQTYGGAAVLPELEKASGYWNYYGTVALANLPEGAGVPSLIRMASLDPNGVAGPGRLQALQMLAQLAGSNEDARNALMQQAKANQIAPNLWPYLARPLAGEEAHVDDSVLNDNAGLLSSTRTTSSHIRHNNQNFYFAPAGGGLTLERVSQQLALLDELKKTTSDPEALRILDRSRTTLEAAKNP